MNTFSKEERLCSKKLIAFLLQNGSSFLQFPLRFTWMLVNRQTIEAASDYPVQVLISVSKKRFKHANKRNRVKRVIREQYRLCKEEELYIFLQNYPNQQLLLMINFVHNELPSSEQIRSKMHKALQKLKHLIVTGNDDNVV